MIVLDVKALHNRLEDLLPLALKSGEPLMNGLISFIAKLKIPPGKGDLIDRLRLGGSFQIDKALFTRLGVQGKVNALSQRGSGQHDPENQKVTASSFRGQFALAGGVMKFSKLTFSVPGASVRLKGAYNLHSKKLNFRGQLRLQAEVSQTTTGWKSLLLKPLDPLFHGKRAGTVLPIRVTGTESDPSFGVEIGRALTRRDSY